MNAISKNHPRLTLSLLWITIMFLMVFADIFSIITELVIGNQIQIPIAVTTAMTIAAFVTSIPILMIVLSWVLPYKINRIANISVGIFTVIYVIAWGSAIPHYIVMAAMEVVLLAVIIRISFKWKEE